MRRAKDIVEGRQLAKSCEQPKHVPGGVEPKGSKKHRRG
jgi:hypothetical protein